MTATLSTIKTATVTSAPAAGPVNTEMSVMMPPGFQEPVSRPMIYIGGEVEGGPCFYTWNKEDSGRDYVPVNRFSASLIELRTVVYNPDDKLTRSVKLIVEFQTPTGARVGMCCGAGTYSSLGLISGLSACSPEQLRGEIGLSGKTGKNGKVTFVNVFANGEYMRNQSSEALLKEAKNDGVMEEAIQGFISDINATLKAGALAEISAALPASAEEVAA